MTHSLYKSSDIQYLSSSETNVLVDAANNGDQAAMARLVESHYPLILKIVHGTFSGNICHEDLVQEGIIGFMRAVKAYKDDGGSSLNSYAYNWVLSSVLNYIYHNRNIVYTLTTKTVRKLANNIGKYTDMMGKITHESRAKMAEDFNVSPVVIDDAVERLRSSQCGIITTSTFDDGNEYSDEVPEYKLGEVESFEEALIEEDYHENILRQLYAIMDEKVNDREREIFISRTTYDEPPTLADLSLKFGISGERVRQLEHQAIKKIRKELPCLAA